jgi:hypothetical protein
VSPEFPAKQNPNRWVIWQVLADIYKVLKREAEREKCLEKIKQLKQ